MIPAAFDYVRAGSAAEAISLIGQHGDEAKFLAGGHSLLPLMKLRLAAPSVLVDIGRVSDLSYIRDAGDHIAIGALTRHMDVETSAVLKEHAPLLAHAASHVGDPQVRHRGTIGGSLANNDPAADYPSAALALCGRVPPTESKPPVSCLRFVPPAPKFVAAQHRASTAIRRTARTPRRNQDHSAETGSRHGDRRRCPVPAVRDKPHSGHHFRADPPFRFRIDRVPARFL